MGCRALIFANGVMEKWPRDLAFPPQADLIICADGGLKHCMRFGLTPDLVVGDMDSVRQSDLSALPAAQVELIRFPHRKDETDLELALRMAKERGAARVMLLGALGRRWDMSISTLLMLASEQYATIDITLYDADETIKCLRGPGRLELNGQQGNRLSLIPISPKVYGVTLDGLEYPLRRAELPLGGTRGISNVFNKQNSSVELDSGCLLLVISPPESS